MSAGPIPNLSKKLGLKTVINARARLTRLGGSTLSPGVWQAMQDAALTYYDMNELHERMGARIAELTRNEAACVTSGASAGLVLTTAACITGADPARIARLPRLEGMKDEVVIHRFQRNHYDGNIRTAGVQLVEIGDHRYIHEWELEAAIGPRTAAVVYFGGPYVGKNILPLGRIIEIAHERGVPVIVDAAAQVPPAENFWRFTGMGADLAVFSGGKALGGPQNTGIILGRKDLVAACRMMGSPHYAIGRPFKVGREEMAGLLAALEEYLDGGERAQLERCERWAEYMMERLAGAPGLRVSRKFPNANTQPLPEVLVEFDEEALGVGKDEVVRRLWEGDPRIDVAPGGDRGICLNPDPMREEEMDVVLDRLKEAVSRPAAGAPRAAGREGE